MHALRALVRIRLLGRTPGLPPPVHRPLSSFLGPSCVTIRSVNGTMSEVTHGAPSLLSAVGPFANDRAVASNRVGVYAESVKSIGSETSTSSLQLRPPVARGNDVGAAAKPGITESSAAPTTFHSAVRRNVDAAAKVDKGANPAAPTLPLRLMLMAETVDVAAELGIPGHSATPTASPHAPSAPCTPQPPIPLPSTVSLASSDSSSWGFDSCFLLSPVHRARHRAPATSGPPPPPHWGGSYPQARKAVSLASRLRGIVGMRIVGSLVDHGAIGDPRTEGRIPR